MRGEVRWAWMCSPRLDTWSVSQRAGWPASAKRSSSRLASALGIDQCWSRFSMGRQIRNMISPASPKSSSRRWHRCSLAMQWISRADLVMREPNSAIPSLLRLRAERQKIVTSGRSRPRRALNGVIHSDNGTSPILHPDPHRSAAINVLSGVNAFFTPPSAPSPRRRPASTSPGGHAATPSPQGNGRFALLCSPHQPSPDSAAASDTRPGLPIGPSR